MLDCTASIVIYRSLPEMIKKSVEKLISASPDIQLYIVDNSPRPDLKSIFDNLPVEFHFSGKNLGYGKAHNWAIEHSKQSQYHLIMNPDVIVEVDTLKLLRKFMDENTDVGVVCPRVLNEDGTDQFLNKRYPNLWDLFIRRFVPSFLYPLLKKRMDRYEMKDVGYDKICDVETVSGAFMFCRKEALKRIGGFDPRYFMYFEDSDLSRKFQQNGYRTVYYPYTTIVHFWERAAHKSFKMMVVFIINAIKYFNKWGWKVV